MHATINVKIIYSVLCKNSIGIKHISVISMAYVVRPLPCCLRHRQFPFNSFSPSMLMCLHDFIYLCRPYVSADLHLLALSLHGSCNYVPCAAVSCGPAPDTPANGQRSVSGTTYGFTVTYTCNRGYDLQGDSRRTCMANSQWSGRTPTCSSKLLCNQMFHYT